MRTHATLIICAFNQQRSVGWAIESLAKQVADIKTQLIVTDDGGLDDTLRKSLDKGALEEFDDYLYIWQENIDFTAGQARNLAIKNALGDIVILIDGDMVPDDRFVQKHIKTHLDRPGSIVSGGRKLIRYSDIPRNSAFDTELFKRLSISNDEEEMYREKWFRSNLPWKSLFSSNMSFPNGHGLLFNERYIGWGIEDWDFAFRAVKKGLSPQFIPNINAFHIDKESYVFNVFRLNSSEGMAKFARNLLIFIDENIDIDLTSCAQALRHYVIDSNNLSWSDTIVEPDYEKAISNVRKWLKSNSVYEKD